MPFRNILVILEAVKMTAAIIDKDNLWPAWLQLENDKKKLGKVSPLVPIDDVKKTFGVRTGNSVRTVNVNNWIVQFTPGALVVMEDSEFVSQFVLVV